jgi:hypothetical protein
MNLRYVPLLKTQRELMGMPLGMDRFRQYVRTMSNAQGDDIDFPPLVLMNPMAKDHVTVLLDELLALDADGIAARAAAGAAAKLADVPGEFPAALIVVDDLKGGWTNRWDYEFNVRFRQGPHAKRFWVTGVLWSSEPASERGVRETILAAVHRAAWVVQHGPARTLRERLAQEGAVLARAGCARPTLEPDDLAYTREVIAPFLDGEDMRTTVECLFGDAAARSLGFTPRGLSPWAGVALALHDAREEHDS